MANQIKDIGNGTGYLYIVDRTGTYIQSALPNNVASAYQLRAHALASGVLPVKQAQNDATKLQDVFDPTFGYRYYIQANYTTTAVPNNLTNAVEITKHVVGRGIEQNIPVITGGDIASDAITITRMGQRQLVTVDTEGSAATDFLDYIDPSDFVHGDEITLIAVEAARVITVRDNDNTVASSKNLYLNGNNNFESGDKTNALTLRFWKPTSGSTPQWHEAHRSNIAVPDYGVVNQRADGVPAMVAGVTVIALLANQANVEVEAGVDAGIIEVTGTSVTLASSWAVLNDATPTTAPIQGDTFLLKWLATGTQLDGNTLTLFGQVITQAILDAGVFAVWTHWNGTTWESILIPYPTVSPFEPGSGTSSAQLTGGNNDASGETAVAEGTDNTASGDYSHAEGKNNVASGEASHAEGEDSTASGDYSHAEGFGGTAAAEYSSVTGRQGTSRVPNQKVHGDKLPSGFGLLQWERTLLQALTTDATKTKLLAQGASTSGLTIPNNSTVKFKAKVVAQQYGGAAGTEKNTAIWEFSGLIQNALGTTTFLDEGVLFHGKYKNTFGHSGTSPQTGTTSAIFLASSSDEWDGAYVNDYVLITGGSAEGEYGRIVAFTGSTREAIVEPGMYGGAFTVAPDITSTYVIVKAQQWEGVGVEWTLDVTANDSVDELVLEFTGMASRNIAVQAVVEAMVIQWSS
jgi:hypothetical protein